MNGNMTPCSTTQCKGSQFTLRGKRTRVGSRACSGKIVQCFGTCLPHHTVPSHMQCQTEHSFAKTTIFASQ